MLLNKHDKKFKEFVVLEDKYHELRQQLRAIPYQPLKEPFQRGWEVVIRLREDIQKRKDAPEILGAIDIGYQKYKLIHTVEDVRRVRAGEKGYVIRKGRERVYVNLIPEKIHLPEKVYDTLIPSVKKYFAVVEDYFILGGKTYTRKYTKICLPDHYIELKARPHMITHQRTTGGAIQSELAELEVKLEEFWRKHSRVNKFERKRAIRKTRAMNRAEIHKIKTEYL